jgi:glycosyltransferase involved in cell wall biosynthesis
MPTLALVMIARDEQRCIARCLHSVRPWVDEMIVLDTGSRDNTVALARAGGARVEHFAWVNDFSAARNAALDLSSADWNLVLDADEWLSTGGEVLKTLSNRPSDFVGSIEVNSEFEQNQGVASAPSWLPRVLPRGVRYAGRIHEHPQHTLRTERLPIHVNHDGYLSGPMLKKGERNQHLLLQALSEQPGDPYLLYQLGKDHEVHDRFAAAWPAYKAALTALCDGDPRKPTWRHDLVLRTLYALKAVGNLDEAAVLADAEMPHWPDSPDFYFVLGDILLDVAITKPHEAEHLIPMIRQAWECCLEIGENPSLEGAVRGRGSVLARHNLTLLQDLSKRL